MQERGSRAAALLPARFSTNNERDRSQTLRKLEALRAVATHAQQAEIKHVLCIWTQLASIHEWPRLPDRSAETPKGGISSSLVQQAAGGRRTLRLLEVLRMVTQKVEDGGLRAAFAAWRELPCKDGGMGAPSATPEDATVDGTDAPACALLTGPSLLTPKLPRLAIPSTLGLAQNQMNDRAPTARLGDGSAGCGDTPRGEGVTRRGGFCEASWSVSLQSSRTDGPATNAVAAGCGFPLAGGFGSAEAAAEAAVAVSGAAQPEAAGSSQTAVDATGAVLVSVATSDLATLMSSVRELRAQRRQLMLESRTASLGLLLRSVLSQGVTEAFSTWQRACLASTAEELLCDLREAAANARRGHFAEIANLREQMVLQEAETVRLQSELLDARADLDASGGKIEQLEAHQDELLREQCDRLKAESALHAKLADAARSESQMQARMEEAKAREGRLHARLGLAHDVAQSAQASIDALTASASDLRAQLAELRAHEDGSLTAAEVEVQWSARCQVLRHALHEAELECLVKSVPRRAAVGQPGNEDVAVAEAEVVAATDEHAEARHRLQKLETAQRARSGCDTKRATARMLVVLRMACNIGCVRALHEWRQAVICMGIADAGRAEAMRIRRTSINLKKNLKDSEAGAHEYEERLQKLTAEVERTRRESATAVAKAGAEKRGVELREKAAKAEMNAANRSARAVSERFRARLLESVISNRPTLLRARRLSASVHRWKHAVRQMVRAGWHAYHHTLTQGDCGSHQDGMRTTARRPPNDRSPPNLKAGGTASANRASRPVPETSPPPPVEKLDPATRRVSLKAPSEASSAAAAREAAREAAPEPTKHAAELAGGRSTDGLAAQWLQGAAEAATRWLRPGEHLDGASARLAALETVKRSWSRSAELPSHHAPGLPFAAGAKSPHAPGGAHAGANGGKHGEEGRRSCKERTSMPMEEMSRYGSPRQARAAREAPAANSASKKASRECGGNNLTPQQPTAAEVSQLKKMIVSSFGKDGAPRLDSVSLYSLGKLLGKGAFGAVKMGVHKLSGSVVAIKNFKKADVKNEVEARAIDREIRILKQSIHMHIVKLYEVIDSPTNYYLVMECAARGDLASHLEKKGRLKEAEAAKYLVQTVEGIAHCHARGVIHRDIKPENLLLDANFDIKVTDFGLSAIIKPGQLLKVACGTPSYSAPEVIGRKEYDGTLTDVWSLGVLLYHVTHGVLPFGSTREIRAGEFKPSSECIPPAALELLCTMLVVLPEQRTSLQKVVGHPWMEQWRPHALREPKRRLGLTHTEPDAEIVGHIEEKFGLRSEHVTASLKGGLYNHATATYSLLEEMRAPAC